MEYRSFLQSTTGLWLDERLSDEARMDEVHDLIVAIARELNRLKRRRWEVIDAVCAKLPGSLPGRFARQGWQQVGPVQFCNEMERRKVSLAEHERVAVLKAVRAGRRRLGPLNAAIGTKERLLDLIVYRLYGLSVDEAEEVDREFAKR